MIYEISPTDFHGISIALALLSIGVIALYFSLKDNESRSLVGALLGAMFVIGGSIGTWVSVSSSLTTYFDYAEGRMENIQQIAGTIESFSSDEDAEIITFTSGETFRYLLYRNNECLLKDISKLPSVSVGYEVSIKYLEPKEGSLVFCVLRIEVKAG
jgi:hypothetical protein